MALSKEYIPHVISYQFYQGQSAAVATQNTNIVYSNEHLMSANVTHQAIMEGSTVNNPNGYGLYL